MIENGINIVVVEGVGELKDGRVWLLVTKKRWIEFDHCVVWGCGCLEF